MVCPNWINVCTEPKGLGELWLRPGEAEPVGQVRDGWGTVIAASDIRDRSAALTDHDEGTPIDGMGSLLAAGHFHHRLA